MTIRDPRAFKKIKKSRTRERRDEPNNGTNQIGLSFAFPYMIGTRSLATFCPVSLQAVALSNWLGRQGQEEGTGCWGVNKTQPYGPSSP
ncbi:unnamed protein product [Protopolystoma xenopodis]|uniref:Uncharacterized protein n=1 Tax=Protopolystoma xenopodis TaxID=117903 RepID=A0A3S5BLM7_9PLAT|nr:unnamed protein product [Protopolystoma xenopodis]